MLLLPLLQDAPPDTLYFLLVGCLFILVLPVLYVLSFYIRQRNLERDLETIETLSKEEKEKPAGRVAAQTSASKAKKPSES